MIKSLLLLYVINKYLVTPEDVPGNLTDLNVCKVSVLGLEYLGNAAQTESNVRCQSWTSNVPHTIKSDVKNEFFPDGSMKKAKNYCRNPTKNPNGPWCYTVNTDLLYETCALPICSYTYCKLTGPGLEYSGKEKKSNSGRKCLKWNKNRKKVKENDTLVYIEKYPRENFPEKNLGNAKKQCRNPSMDIGGPWCFTENSETEQIEKEYCDIPLCDDMDCLVFTNDNEINTHYSAFDSSIDNITFSVKLWDPDNYFKATARLVLSKLPLPLSGKDIENAGVGFEIYLSNDYSTLAFGNADSEPEKIKTTELLQSTKYVTFSMTWQNNFVQLSIEGQKNPLFLMEFKDKKNLLGYKKLKFEYYSISGTNILCSVDSVAHWSFYCAPPDFVAPPPAVLPECALSEEELNYEGTQDVTASGLPCLPWSTKKLLPDQVEVEMFGGNLSAVQAVNYCRDPLKMGQGTFCYAKSLKSKIQVQKVFCRIRKCKSEHCKLAGTGNDFMGVITQTRSNRTCDVWYQSVWENVDRVIYNDTLFPDVKLGNAKNHCRNPSRNIAGAWCYTTDPEIIMDACNVRDCEKPEECIVITKATNKGHKVYVLPQWKEEGVHGGIQFSLKEWSADEYDGLSIFVSPWQGNEEIRLDIGAEGNEKVTLTRNGKIMQTHSIPHVIKSGSWAELWLQVRAGEVLLGYQGIPDPFLEYIDYTNKFQPGYLSFSSIHGFPIGIFFDCHECHTELAEVDDFSKTYSFGIWSDKENDMYRNITFNLRGAGLARILLTNLPYSGYKLVIEFNPTKSEIKLNPVYNGIPIETVTRYARNLYTDLKWSTYFLTFTEYQMELYTNETRMFTYTSEAPLVFYWFSVASKDGSVSWSANCPPLDIDGEPRNGGWSEWSDWVCSVTCGGGDGYQYRTCTNPRPNIKGEMCVGEASTTGRCNEFPCGDVSPTTLERIKGKLRGEHFSYVVHEDTAVILENNREIVKVVNRESPQAYFEWTKNGVYIEEEPHHFYNRLDNLQIKHIRHNDSGVYICILKRVNKQRVVVRVFTVAVISKNYNVVTRETRKYVLNCKANLLGYVYSDLILKLTINNTLYKEYEIGMLLAIINSYNIDSLNKSHHGTWKCVVNQPDLEIEWVTNYVKINVQKAPNLLTNLMEDEMTAPFFAWLKTETNVLIALIFIILFTIGVTLEGARKKTMVHKALWKFGPTQKKKTVAMKILKKNSYDRLEDFLKISGQWAFLQSDKIVRLYGITMINDISFILEYFPYGPLDIYLRNNEKLVTKDNLIQAATDLASALWHLDEKQIVHGKIRCRKLLVANHNDKILTIKLTDPGIHSSYPATDIHWIPVECYGNFELARESHEADVWACGTTLWEMYSFGADLTFRDHEEAKKRYLKKEFLPKPIMCPDEVYTLIKECWEVDHHRRKKPQAIMVCNNAPEYAQPTSLPLLRISASNSTQSLISGVTESTNVYGGSLLSNEDNCYGLSYGEDKDINNFVDPKPGAFNYFDNMNKFEAQEGIRIDEECYVVPLNKIGQGNYGEVYRGKVSYHNDAKESRIVALKKLKREDEDTLLDFEREIQIMQGMEYLGRKKIVHRDLAARNILIDERDRAKISDFGLAQVLDDSGYYLLKSVRGIPYKWYALECLTKQKFSTSSDVWSFGVTVWEIFSDGEEPDLLNKDESHQDVQVQFIHKLQQGLNYPAPLNCKLQKVYTLLILPCWNRDPHDRPTFSELMKTTEDILRDI
ncbi:unnamed protein product [Brassicogethes aeneus]|uniref:receptor protein-tyrosine kinase n=1 Tax=Brassicogethes aeneus TaxID=1431903 RepID=A0A9P0FCT9_BRAAE|nr:unnamed protein product [Brassicogethes aeneus]